VSAVVASAGTSLGNRRNAALAALLAVALSLAIAVGFYNRGGFRGLSSGNVGDAVRHSVNQGFNSISALGETVASLFGSRSPGERADGTFANMKQRKHPALHQRALPKVRRGPTAPVAVASPVAPTIPPEAAPLYNAVTGAPKAGAPGTQIAFSPPGGGGAPVFPGVFAPGGGGGVVGPPPVTIGPPETPVTPITPVTPVPLTPSVPEPATWMMMLLGFGSMGGFVRRSRTRSLASV